MVLTLKYPDILPVLSNCERQASRKQISVTREQAYVGNLEVMAKLTAVRLKIATLLGFDSWARLVTSQRMSGSPEAVHTFLDEIHAKAKDAALSAVERLRMLKVNHLKERAELDANDADGAAVKLEPWDSSFYQSALLKTECVLTAAAAAAARRVSCSGGCTRLF